MKFYSEKTKKYYDKADDCVAEEAKFDKELAQKEEAAALAKAEKEKAVALRKEEAKKIEEKIAERAKLDKEIDTLMNEFTKKYGSFHYTFKDSDCSFSNFFEYLINQFLL